MITVNGWREPLNETVIVLVGTDDETGEIVHVAADHRPAKAIIEALMADKTGANKPQIDPEPYQIISRRRMTLGDYGYNND